MHITRHARQRLAQRAGVERRNCGREAANAQRFGLRHNVLACGLLGYIVDVLGKHERDVTAARIFRLKLYIFDHDVLITVLNLPYKFHREVKELSRQAVNKTAMAKSRRINDDD